MKRMLIVAAAMLASAPVLAQRIPLPGIPVSPVAPGGAPGFPGMPQGVPGTPQELQAMLAGLEAAQAAARRPGDENLSCETLQAQIGETMKDPAITAHFAAAATAQAQAMQGIAAQRMQSQATQMEQLTAVMPKLARSQRLVELAVMKNCEWLAGSDFALPSGALALPAAPLPQASSER
jgi:hypothetical protein